ncbi:actin-like protein Arp10 [Schizosaccharomyces japonicus yFS275]|uniref:Actin-like protein Arp10 n=1 Tax=Schizosaccharomyces japonicus (strain yFS275 / FY16936) TaxID=402676 RepID=B6JVH4_SCHJY|nr:actin-like protein Arp10 [Schizosaccharomyces japonicus yFS275]EEB05375.1 actin-like protein Arp10 [Schizosaccharomyces japonicus yFS275]
MDLKQTNLSANHIQSRGRKVSNVAATVQLSDGPVVIEIAETFINVGIAGECLPRVQWTIDLSSNELTQTLLKIYREYLFLQPSFRPVILVESALNSLRVKYHLTDVLLKQLHIPDVYFLCTQLCSIVAAEEVTAIVIDVGWKETCILAVTDFFLHPKFIQTVHVGLKDVLLRFRSLLYQKNKNETMLENVNPVLLLPTLLQYGQVFHLQERQPYPLSPEQAHNSYCTHTDENSVLDYIIDGQRHSLQFSSVMTMAAVERVFEGWNALHLDIQEQSLPLVLHHFINNLSVDVRCTIQNRVLFTGMLANVPGWTRRFAEEMKVLGTEIRILSSKFPAHLSAWIGASLVGPLQQVISGTSTTESPFHLDRPSFLAGSLPPDWLSNSR